MHVYCTDGTVFECASYDVNEHGLVLYGTDQQRERERYETDDAQQVGFVPHERLWYVLPMGVTPQVGLAPPGGQQSVVPGGQGTPSQPQPQQPQPQQPKK